MPVAADHRNPYLADVVVAAARALDIPLRERWNDGPYADGAGFLEIGYDPITGIRSSSSVAYLHPIMDARANLDVLTDTRVLRVLIDETSRATGVAVCRPDGSHATIKAAGQIVLSCGAIDTPRLLLLSGVGPGQPLQRLGIKVAADVPGVGENLSDHPEGLVVWEASRPIPRVGATDWDISIMFRSDPACRVPDVLAHAPLMTYAVHAEAVGLAVPELSASMTPNVTRPRSRGRVWLGSPDPTCPR